MARINVNEKTTNLLEENFFECVTILKGYGIDVDYDSVCCDMRDSDLVFQRALVAFFLRKRGFSLLQIGYFINRDHSTVIHLLDKYPKRTQGLDPRYPEIVKELGPLIKGDKMLWSNETKIAYHEEILRGLYLERDILKASKN